MNFDKVFVYIGEVGWYQVGLFVLLGLPNFYFGYMVMCMTFLAYTPPHVCSVDRLKDFSMDIQRAIGVFACLFSVNFRPMLF